MQDLTTNKKIDIRYKNYNYYILLSGLLTREDGTTYEMPLNSYMSKVYLIHLYNEFVFPVIKVELTVTPQMYEEITRYIDTTKFRISILKTLADASGENKVTTLPERFINNVIAKAIDFNRHHYPMPDIVKETGFTENGEIKMTLELISIEHLRINRTPLTGAIRNTNMQDLLAYFFGEFVTDQKLLLHEPNNEKLYKQIMAPTKNLPNTIKYLQEVYGIYYSGLRIFFDFDKYYCLPNDLIMNDVKKGDDPLDYDNVFININDQILDGSFIVSGSYIDYDRHMYKILSRNINIFDFGDTGSREDLGEEIEVLKTTMDKDRMKSEKHLNKPGVLTKDDNFKDTNVGVVKKKKYYNKYDNDFAMQSKIYKRTKENLRIMLLFENIDISYIAPNRRFYMEFNNIDLNQKYRGSYQISNMISTFTRNGDVFECQSLATFERLTKDILSLS